jgi:ApbE superfamily uncharacterized protein (UPF0280 family)
MKKQVSPLDYNERTYRRRVRTRGLVSFQVQVKETDLWVSAVRDLTVETRDLVLAGRHPLEHYIRACPSFLTSLVPIPEDPYAPPLVKEMMKATAQVGIGPMAAVAGVIAQYVGEGLLSLSREVIVENGGDLFLAAKRPVTVAIFAGGSPLSGRMGIRVYLHQMPLGVCTSSGTIGHSLSLGKADAVCVVSRSAALADAAATALGNKIKGVRDIEPAIHWAKGVEGILGGVVIIGATMASWGEVELANLQEVGKGQRA